MLINGTAGSCCHPFELFAEVNVNDEANELIKFLFTFRL